VKAPIFKGVGKPLVIETLPDPTPGPGEIVIKVSRCGICGTDLHMTDGHAHTFPEGTVIGHEFAGEVVAIGAGVRRFKIGDAAAALPTVGCGHCANCLAGETAWCDSGLIGKLGGFGQYAIACDHASIKLPSTLSVEDGALVEPLAVALHGVTLAELKPGAKVLVQGAGPIGLGCVFWSKYVGAGRIAVTSRSRRCETIAMDMGASAFVQTSEQLQVDVNAALGGPPDVVFECVGVTGQLAQATHLVRPRGTVVLLGNCMVPDTIVPALAMMKQVRIQGSMVYSVGEFETVADVLNAGRVDPRVMVTDTIGYAELPETFEALRRPTTQCKVLLNPHA
jgi:threonine dehydrogenase-like Zn-dependent dehydrogenase